MTYTYQLLNITFTPTRKMTETHHPGEPLALQLGYCNLGRILGIDLRDVPLSEHILGRGFIAITIAMYGTAAVVIEAALILLVLAMLGDGFLLWVHGGKAGGGSWLLRPWN